MCDEARKSSISTHETAAYHRYKANLSHFDEVALSIICICLCVQELADGVVVHGFTRCNVPQTRDTVTLRYTYISDDSGLLP